MENFSVDLDASRLCDNGMGDFGTAIHERSKCLVLTYSALGDFVFKLNASHELQPDGVITVYTV